MAQENYSGAERRSETAQIVNELLALRQQVWKTYCRIAELKPFHKEKSVVEQMEAFCQILVDYVALGHFGIYQRIVNGNERRTRVIAVAEEIYPRIAKATDAVIDFNDKYENLKQELDKLQPDLGQDLSSLGEELATRIELEDQLIETMVG